MSHEALTSRRSSRLGSASERSPSRFSQTTHLSHAQLSSGSPHENEDSEISWLSSDFARFITESWSSAPLALEASLAERSTVASVNEEGTPLVPLSIQSSSHPERRERDGDDLSSGHRQAFPPHESLHQHPSAWDWLPVTLRWSYLTVLLSLSMGLGCITLFLMCYSVSNQGLGKDDGSNILLFGWRFSPTLLAVIYVLLVSTMLHDIRRTEPFARLSRKNGAPAASTLFLTSRSWWNDPVDAWDKCQNNGVRSWILLCASIVNILGILLVSPLSAGLLSPVETDIVKNVDFKSFIVFDGSLPQPIADDSTYFRTISTTLLNTTTSAWLTNDFAVLPFWPSTLDGIPLGASLPGAPQKWTGPTTVFQALLDCSPMSSSGVSNFTFTDTSLPKYPLEVNGTGFMLRSGDGCSIMLGAQSDYEDFFEGSNFVVSGGGWWTSAASNYWSPAAFADSGTGTGMTNFTGNCGPRNMFFVNAPYQPNTSFAAQGYVCSSGYVAANLTATVSITKDSSNVAFDLNAFNRLKIPIDSRTFNTSLIENAFLSDTWSTRTQNPRNVGGALLPLAVKHNFNLRSMLADGSLLHDALQIKQRFFGEMLLSSLEQMEIQKSNTIPGTIITTERRILVSVGIAITLTAIFGLSTVLMVAVIYLSRPHRRPLNLSHDPGSTATVASLVSSETGIRTLFENCDQLPVSSMYGVLGCKGWFIRDGTLDAHDGVKLQHVHGKLTPNFRPQSKNRDWRPVVLRGWVGLILAICLVSLVITIIVLFVESRKAALHQAALVHQFNFHLVGQSVMALAPYSILPTLIAVGVKLWWGAIEEVFKRLQPYATMAKGSVGVSHALTVEYMNSPLLATVAKAVRNSHWLLAVISLGAFGTEIFTIAMSALWNREPGSLVRSMVIPRQLELRIVPEIFVVPSRQSFTDTILPSVIKAVYGNFLTSWLYGATVELAYNATTPAWSSENWSFVPLDLTAIPVSASAHTSSDLGSQKRQRNTSVTPLLSSNVTVETPALRGRLQCTPVDLQFNTSTWLKAVNFTNDRLWNSTISPPGLGIGYELQLWATPKGSLACCGNETDGIPGQAAVGYWDEYYPNDQSRRTSVIPRINVGWIVGQPLGRLLSDIQGNAHWFWMDIPKTVMLDCAPIVESANARVTVNLANGTVEQYTILDEPTNFTGAWTDDYIEHARSVDSTVPYDGILSNVTVSYGYVFFQSLLKAANVVTFGQYSHQVQSSTEELKDRVFNFRIRGLNVDFMSYSMFTLANGDAEALLDVGLLSNLSNQVFGTFFKHFVSENVTVKGGWGFQTIGDKLPWSLGGFKDGSYYGMSNNGNYLNSTFVTDPNAHVIVRTPVDQLVMAPAAVVLCLMVLSFLITITIIIYIFYRQYFKALPRDVDTLASVLGFVYDSPRLLQWVKENQASKDWNHKRHEGDGLMVKMGYFEGSEKKQRWGVEILEGAEVVRLTDERSKNGISSDRRSINAAEDAGRTDL